MEYEGIMFWGVDHDVFAANVGRYMSKNPPRKIKVVNLEHMSAPDGLKAYLQLHPELKRVSQETLCDIIGEDHHKKLRSVDLRYIKDIIDPHEDSICSRHNAKFSIELHSTNMLSTRSIEPKVYITCHMNSFNKKGADLLRKYADEVSYAEKDHKESLNDIIMSFRVYANTGAQYHLIQLEFVTNACATEKKHAIRSVGEFTRELSDYLVTDYWKLWKRYCR